MFLSSELALSRLGMQLVTTPLYICHRENTSHHTPYAPLIIIYVQIVKNVLDNAKPQVNMYNYDLVPNLGLLHAATNEIFSAA